MSPAAPDRTLFLPDFCAVRVLFTVVVLAELLAFVLALGPGGGEGRWLRLSLTSLFVQWVALSNCALLCLLRPRLRGLRVQTIAIICFLLIILVTLLISEAGYIVNRGFALEAMLAQHWHAEFVLRNLAISAIIAAVCLRYFYVQHQLQLSIEARSRAQIEALQARIRPHFLFNSMNTIASMTRSDPVRAEAIVEDLADLFRASLAVDDAEVSLAHEIELCRRYIDIEKARLGERLEVVWTIDDRANGIRVPALSLQPLLENAIYHGIEPLAAGGQVIVIGQLTDEGLRLSVSNPLPPAGMHSRRRRQRMALQNIRERLASLYGSRAGLDIVSEAGTFTATLIIPFEVAGGRA
jgi:two-component system sensor histidine kinase AlgZ